MGYPLRLALVLAFLLANVAVAPAADPPRPGHAAYPALDADETDGFDDDQQVEPSLPDDEDPDLDERSGPPRLGPRSEPSLPDEEEPPPADVEPARAGRAAPASPAEPLHPLGE
jgi:hypothetical protein